MGLTIHFAFAAGQVATDRARELVRELRDAGLDLFAGEVKQIAEIVEGSCFSEDVGVASDADFLNAMATRPLMFKVGDEDKGCFVSPTDLIGFIASPGEGCEAVPVGLAKYPAAFEFEGQRIPTNLDGWRWQGFVKTQYGSNERLGGIKHFLLCHLGVISLLDRAKELGILEKVVDESDYWEKRDVAALVKEVGRWNSMIAGLVGRLRDGLEKVGGDRRRLVSEISKFPDFEYLEAEGRAGEQGGREQP